MILNLNLSKLFSFLFKKEQPANPESGYEVHFHGVRQSIEPNLLAVSKKYDELKKSTLYRFFDDESEESKTYRKNGYTVTKTS